MVGNGGGGNRGGWGWAGTGCKTLQGNRMRSYSYKVGQEVPREPWRSRASAQRGQVPPLPPPLPSPLPPPFPSPPPTPPLPPTPIPTRLHKHPPTPACPTPPPRSGTHPWAVATGLTRQPKLALVTQAVQHHLATAALAVEGHNNGVTAHHCRGGGALQERGVKHAELAAPGATCGPTRCMGGLID